MKIKHDSQAMKLLIIIGIVILPFIYSLVYLTGFWDPYNSLNKVPVALVNLDECEKDCKGEELIDSLKDKEAFKFDVVSEKKAKQGLINKDYYAVIQIPKDFTNNLMSASTTEKHQAEIIYAPNTKTSYLASQIIKSAMSEIEANLQSNVNKEIVSTLSDNLNSVPKQTEQISDALGTIHEGTTSVNDGTLKLKNGINTLSTNYKTFNNGVEKLLNGSNTLNSSYGQFNDGINEAYNGTQKLKVGLDNADFSSLNTLTNGSTEFKTGLDTYKSSADTFTSQTEAAFKGFVQFYEALSDNNDPNQIVRNQLKDVYAVAKGYTTTDPVTHLSGIEALREGLGSLDSNYNALNEGIQSVPAQISDSLKPLKQGITDLDNGLSKLQANSNKIYSGIGELNKGLKDLSSGSNQINSGLETASTGANTLADGTNTLNNGVSEAKQTVDKKIDETKKETEKLDGLDKYAKDSVNVNEEDYGDVKNYGTFFSPFFMSLSLWLGGILMLMGLYYDPDSRFKILGKETNHRVARLVTYNIIGVVQAIILGFILQLCLRFDVTNIWLYYGSCILISEAFLAIIVLCFFHLKDVGKFIVLLLLVLQLASCGGTFPVETEPVFYQILNPIMPMTYSVDLLRESFVNINSEFLIKDIIILLSIFVICNGITILISLIKSKNEKKAK